LEDWAKDGRRGRRPSPPRAAPIIAELEDVSHREMLSDVDDRLLDLLLRGRTLAELEREVLRWLTEKAGAAVKVSGSGNG
jgi:hypothetical protein